MKEIKNKREKSNKPAQLNTGKCNAQLPASRTTKSKANTTKQSEYCAPSYLRGSESGQISAEFVVTLILLFLMFSIIVFISTQQKENINFSSDKIKAKTLMEKTSIAVNGIYLSGNGSTTKITKDFDLNMEIEENILMVKFRKGQFVSNSLLTKQIVLIQKNNANKIEIKNKNGVIEIEEI